MYPYRLVLPETADDTSRAGRRVACVSGDPTTAAKNTIVWDVLIGAASIFALYVLSFGPAWGLYKRGHIFSKSVMRCIYTPLVKVADQHLCPLDLPGLLLWS